jgi:class 3 adenylate cyclase
MTRHSAGLVSATREVALVRGAMMTPLRSQEAGLGDLDVTTGAESVQVEAASTFPGRNPNPIMRVSLDGRLEYANEASQPIRTQLGVTIGARVPSEFLGRLTAAARATPPGSFELECGVQTFAILSVPVESVGGMNVYGTDITGAKVVEKFPDRNPNPVLRFSVEGRLLYANTASAGISRALGIAVGDPLPAELARQLERRLAGEADGPIEVSGDGHTYALDPVAIPEFGFTNVYGTDVTALHAINKFPDENPNPVLRVSQSGTLTYANPASAIVMQAFGLAIGEALPSKLFDQVRDIIEGRAPNVIEAQHSERIVELRVVSLFEFESINLYGTDVTAARQVEKANAENERLLLNILPISIAERLRRGEEPIADAFDEMVVLFADVVDFTPYSATRPAREVVAVLNQIFSIFDRLVDRYRLEKIKTVGDAYMVAGGLTPDGGGAEEVADMALDMIDEMHRYRTESGAEMQIRVGLHIGPGVGGVIGLKKFIYDVWGDTVNTASRMESLGLPGSIQVTAATADRLRNRYAFERRGMVDVKGKGEIETYLLKGRAKR